MIHFNMCFSKYMVKYYELDLILRIICFLSNFRCKEQFRLGKLFECLAVYLLLQCISAALILTFVLGVFVSLHFST